MDYKNYSEEQRVWPGVQRPDGTTLELEPGEVVELDDLPEGFNDPYLKPVGYVPPTQPTGLAHLVSADETTVAEGADHNDDIDPDNNDDGEQS